MDKLTARFINTTGYVMTIVASSGKSEGVNLKASVKVSKDTKAVTVAREKATTDAAAKVAFERICKEVEAKGWVRKAGGGSKVFSSIPAATAEIVGGVKAVRAPKAKKAAKATKAVAKKAA